LYQVQASSMLRGSRVADLMSRDCGRVDAAASAQEFVDWHLMRSESRCFLVFEAERIVGLVALSDVRKVDRELWRQTPVRAIMQPIERVHAVAPDTPVMEALEKMAREDVNQLLVVSSGQVLGVVTRAHILQVLRVRSELLAA
jgi:predicted transcriptional regulator